MNKNELKSSLAVLLDLIYKTTDGGEGCEDDAEALTRINGLAIAAIVVERWIE